MSCTRPACCRRLAVNTLNTKPPLLSSKPPRDYLSLVSLSKWKLQPLAAPSWLYPYPQPWHSLFVSAAIMSFGSRKKDRPRPRFNPDAVQRGAICWQVVADEQTPSKQVRVYVGILCAPHRPPCRRQGSIKTLKSIVRLRLGPPVALEITGTINRQLHHQANLTTVNRP